MRSDLKEGLGSGKEILERQISSYDTMITHRKKAGMIDREQEKAMCAALQALNDCLMALAVEGTGDAKEISYVSRNCLMRGSRSARRKFQMQAVI